MKKLKLEVEFILPEGVGLAEAFLRLGIRIKQIAQENVRVSLDEPMLENFKGDLTVRNMTVLDV